MNTTEYKLSKKLINFLFLYYGALLIACIILSIRIFIALFDGINDNCILHLSFISSIISAIMMCSVNYIRKLYKNLIAGNVSIEEKDTAVLIGCFAYFFFRPFFAIALVIIVIVAILSGAFMVIGSLDYIINQKFLFLCYVIAGFVGYSTGITLDKFERISKENINKVKES